MTNLDGQMIPFAPLKKDGELTTLLKNKSNRGFTKQFSFVLSTGNKLLLPSCNEYCVQCESGIINHKSQQLNQKEARIFVFKTLKKKKKM